MKEPILLNKQDTAHVLSVSTQAFSKWDIAPAQKRGREVLYDLKEVVSFRLRREENTEDRPKELLEQQINYTRERAEKTAIEKEKTDLELEVLKGNLFPKEIVEYVWKDQVGNIRAKLLAVPARAANVLHGLGSPSEIEQILRDFLYETLEELSDYVTDEYKINSELAEVSKSSLKATPKAKSKRVGRRKKTTKQRSKL